MTKEETKKPFFTYSTSLVPKVRYAEIIKRFFCTDLETEQEFRRMIQAGLFSTNSGFYFQSYLFPDLEMSPAIDGTRLYFTAEEIIRETQKRDKALKKIDLKGNNQKLLELSELTAEDLVRLRFISFHLEPTKSGFKSEPFVDSRQKVLETNLRLRQQLEQRGVLVPQRKGNYSIKRKGLDTIHLMAPLEYRQPSAFIEDKELRSVLKNYEANPELYFQSRDLATQVSNILMSTFLPPERGTLGKLEVIQHNS